MTDTPKKHICTAHDYSSDRAACPYCFLECDKCKELEAETATLKDRIESQAEYLGNLRKDVLCQAEELTTLRARIEEFKDAILAANQERMDVNPVAFINAQTRLLNLATSKGPDQ